MTILRHTAEALLLLALLPLAVPLAVALTFGGWLVLTAVANSRQH